MERYQRHEQLEGFGKPNQQKLTNAKVMVIGVGGLGCPVLMSLAGMGIGTLGLVDGDIVEKSNLHRQLLFTESDIGKNKALVAAHRLREMNADISIHVFVEKVHPKNICDLIEEYDIVVDGTDHISIKYLINDACVMLHKTLIYGAIFQYEGQVAVFNVMENGIYSCHYRDLFPHPEKNINVASCNVVGVLGILPNIIGMLMANEVVKILTGIGKPLVNQLLYYNIKNNDQTIFRIEKNMDNTAVFTRSSIESGQYDFSCFGDNSLTKQQLLDMFSDKNKSILIDVRESFESPNIKGFPFLNIPINKLEEQKDILASFENIVFICQTGNRSLKAFEWAKQNLPEVGVFHFQPGVRYL
ncbi:MAG: HesA/MoeB/ThiF family protein [Saprospiraceae bacterium]